MTVITISIDVNALRAAYMPGRKKMGEVINPGFRYQGRTVTKAVFDRNSVVRYWEGEDCFATFCEIAGVDD